MNLLFGKKKIKFNKFNKNSISFSLSKSTTVRAFSSLLNFLAVFLQHLFRRKLQLRAKEASSDQSPIFSSSFFFLFCSPHEEEASAFIRMRARTQEVAGRGNERFCPAAGETARHRKYEERVRFRHHPRNPDTGTTENGLKLARPLFRRAACVIREC